MATESKYEVDPRKEEDVFPVVYPGFAPKGNRILVQLRKAKDVSKGGIVLVAETKASEKWNDVIAKVIAVGPLAYKDVVSMQDWPEGPWCKVGDIVRVIRYGGDRWSVPHGESEVNFVVIQDKEVIGTLDSYEVARTMFPAFVE